MIDAEEDPFDDRSHDLWDPDSYDGRHSFVWRLADEVLDMLDPRPGERILDIGCGTGHLTARIRELGAHVVGIDNSQAMIDEARSLYPNLDFECVNAREYVTEEPFDAVFSNATLHWVGEPELTAWRIWAALKPGGRFVAEFGGRGNIGSIVDALIEALREVNAPPDRLRNPWYFPGADEYASVLEDAGFQVETVRHLDRPTHFEGGKQGLANWLKVFASAFLEGLNAEQTREAVDVIENRLRPILFHDGTWVADYKRLRVAARRPD